MTKACHEITLAMHTDGQKVMYYRNVVYLHTCSSDNDLMSVAGRAKLQYSGNLESSDTETASKVSSIA